MASWLKRQRSRLDDDLARRGLAHTFSLARYTLHHATQQLIERHATGVCLDVGSGRAPYRDLLVERCERVVTLDVERRTEDVDLIGDIQNLEGVDSASFDTVVCTQVLEHVPRPWDAMREIRRVLKPGGRLILTVPHLSALHEVPHDYYRYTGFGLEALCRASDLEVARIGAAGGLVAFLSHGFSYVFLTLMSPIPLLRWLAWGINYGLLCRIAGILDALMGLRSLYPCNSLLVASRPLDAESDR